MGDTYPKCPYCLKGIDPITIMGDSDWNDQGIDTPYETECPYCERRFYMTQVHVEVIRHFSIKKEKPEYETMSIL